MRNGPRPGSEGNHAPGGRPADGFRWNPRAQQPHRPVGKFRRNLEHLRHLPSHLRLLALALGSLPGIARAYRRRARELWPQRPIPPGFGVSTDGGPGLLSRGPAEIAELGAQSVLVRVPVWDLGRLEACRSFLEQARERGLSTVAAVLQDRRAVLDPPYWRAALEEIFGTLAPVTGAFEIGHAWNRFKWGVHSLDEYRALLDAARETAATGRDVRLAGPAVIDFEFHQIVGALSGSAPFDAVTSLLYVDRRGAPENRQWGFDLAGKLALLRAVADVSPSAAAPVWISEMNWPLPVPGGYSPTSMKEAINEETQADFLVRYYVTALASGMVERVYWWQLAAPGYGLIDDRDGAWRRRPAWQAFATMVRLLAGTRLEKAVPRGPVRSFLFRNPSGGLITAAWTTKGRATLETEHPAVRLLDRDGNPLGTGRMEARPSPRYVLSF